MLPTIVPQRDPRLTAMVLAYQNGDLVGDSIGPILESDTKKIEYTMLDKLNLFQDVDATLARGGEANTVGLGGEQATVGMRNFGLNAVVLNEDIEDADDWFNVASESLTMVTSTLALQREKLQAAMIKAALTARSSDPGNWGNLDPATAPDIFAQIKDQMEASVYGYDSIIIPEPVLFKMQRAPSLLAQFYSGNTGMKTVSEQNIKEMFGLKNIIVPKARISTVRRPLKVTDVSSIGRVWANDVILFKKATGIPSRMDPGFFYQWRRRWLKGAVGQNMQVRTWSEPKRGIGGAYVVQQEYQAHQHIFPEAGYAFTSVLT